MFDLHISWFGGLVEFVVLADLASLGLVGGHPCLAQQGIRRQQKEAALRLWMGKSVHNRKLSTATPVSKYSNLTVLRLTVLRMNILYNNNTLYLVSCILDTTDEYDLRVTKPSQ